MSESDQSGAGRREVAYRLFAAEFEQADYSYSESDEERAPSYVITPTGARANRLFLVGVLTEVEQVSDDVLRGRVVDPTGAFVLYAGQYQPDEQAFLDRAEPPTFVAVTGKARTFQPEDSDQVFTSIRPESISEVDASTRDRWTVQTAEQTHRRIRLMAKALSLDDRNAVRQTLVEDGADDGLAHGIELALDHYNPTPTYLHAVHEMSLDAARVVAGQKDEIDGVSYDPGYEGEVTLSALLAAVGTEELALSAESSATTGDDSTASDVSKSEPSSESSPEPSTTSDSSTASETLAAADSDDQNEVAAESAPDTAVGAGTTDDSVETESPAAEPDTSEAVESDETERAPGSTDTDDLGGDDSTEESDDSIEEVGDFTADSSSESPEESVSAENDDDELGDFDAGEFELEEETREEIEEEFGTEFQSGTEVDEPGAAGIETPDPDTQTEPPAESPDAEPRSVDSDAESVSESSPIDSQPSTDPSTEQADTAAKEKTDEPPAQAETDEPPAQAETDEPADLQAAVVELMSELDAGDGADRDDLIAEMNARYGTDRDTVEDAIEDALMAGECYEPDETLLKPI